MKEETAKEIIAKSMAGYDRIAKQFSQTRNKFWTELHFVKDYIKEGDTLLDIGCGNGRFFDFIKDKNVRYTGIDNSKELIKIAQNKYGGAGKFILADAIELPLENEGFDTVVSFAVLHHIPSKKFREEFLEEANRVLKKDGLLILTVWNLWSTKFTSFIYRNIALKILGLSKLDFKDAFLGFRKEKDVRFLHAFTKNELEKLILKTDFSIEKSEKITAKSGQSNFLIIARKK